MENSGNNDAGSSGGCLLVLLMPAIFSYTLVASQIFTRISGLYEWWQAVIIAATWPIFLAETAIEYILAHPQF